SDIDPELQLWETLSLCSATAKTTVLLGDLNARTGCLSPAHQTLQRISSDEVVNRRGRDLLAAAQDFHLSILNGTRKEDHSPGRYTSFQPNGCAVVDYAVVTSASLASVGGLAVAAPTPHSDDAWADHVQLVLSLNTNLIRKTRRRANAQATVQWP
ncbi:hypothetical protein FPV67DRAFT_1381679, partial [Lyophyllum atratum]